VSGRPDPRGAPNPRLGSDTPDDEADALLRAARSGDEAAFHEAVLGVVNAMRRGSLTPSRRLQGRLAAAQDIAETTMPPAGPGPG